MLATCYTGDAGRGPSPHCARSSQLASGRDRERDANRIGTKQQEGKRRTGKRNRLYADPCLCGRWRWKRLQACRATHDACIPWQQLVKASEML